jgi:hypothetical protein
VGAERLPQVLSGTLATGRLTGFDRLSDLIARHAWQGPAGPARARLYLADPCEPVLREATGRGLGARENGEAFSVEGTPPGRVVVHSHARWVR